MNQFIITASSLGPIDLTMAALVVLLVAGALLHVREHRSFMKEVDEVQGNVLAKKDHLRFGSRVMVTYGFHKGRTGEVVDSADYDLEYLVSFPDSRTAWISIANLELAKSNQAQG